MRHLLDKEDLQTVLPVLFIAESRSLSLGILFQRYSIPVQPHHFWSSRTRKRDLRVIYILKISNPAERAEFPGYCSLITHYNVQNTEREKIESGDSAVCLKTSNRKSANPAKHRKSFILRNSTYVSHIVLTMSGSHRGIFPLEVLVRSFGLSTLRNTKISKYSTVPANQISTGNWG